MVGYDGLSDEGEKKKAGTNLLPKKESVLTLNSR